MKLIRLSQQFYSSHSNCPEILTKHSRPYVCLAVKIDGVVYAIPIRHHIPHKHKFQTIDDAGLDYTKAVVISSRDDIDPSVPQIEQAEFNIIKRSERTIESGMRKYVSVYKKALQYPDNPHYRQILSLSALQYFKDKI